MHYASEKVRACTFRSGFAKPRVRERAHFPGQEQRSNDIAREIVAFSIFTLGDSICGIPSRVRIPIFLLYGTAWFSHFALVTVKCIPSLYQRIKWVAKGYRGSFVCLLFLSFFLVILP